VEQRRSFLYKKIIAQFPARNADPTLLYGDIEGEYLRLTNAGLLHEPEDDDFISFPEPTGGDDTALLNSFFAGSTNKVLIGKAGARYKITSELQVKTGCTIWGNGMSIDATGIPSATALDQKFAITSSGSIGATVAISTLIVKWQTVITGIASTAGISAGDILLIANNEVPVPGMVRAGNDRLKGEMVIVKSVDSSSQITLQFGTQFGYSTSGLTLQEITPVVGVEIYDITIDMGDGVTGAGKRHNGIQIRYGRDIILEKVNVNNAEDCAVGYKYVLNGLIEKGAYRGSTSSSTGYGVVIWEASQHVVVRNNYFYNNKHHVAGGGYYPPIYVDVINNHGQLSASAAWDCHESCYYWNFKDNTSQGSTHGFYLRGQYITADGNSSSDCNGEAYAVHTYDSVTEQRGIRILNGVANHCNYGISVGKASGENEHTSYDVEIINMTMRDCGTNPIRVRDFDGATILDNKIYSGSASGMLLEGQSSGVPSKNLTVGNNKVNNSGTHGIQIQFVDDVTSANDTAYMAGQHGIYFLTCNRIDLTSPKVRASAQYGIFIDGGTGHCINGGHVSGGSGATYDSLRVTNVTGLSVNGGYYQSLRYGIFTTTTDKVIIIGTNCRDTTHATKINCDATTQTISPNLIT
jgi:hypothetical protein